MRRSICYCEPNYALAGEVNTWKFVYTTASNLPKGTVLRFDMLSNGRDIDWEVPTVNMKKAGNVIYLKLDDDKTVQGKEIKFEDRFTPQYEFVLPAEVETGANLTFIVGSSKKDEKTFKKNGTCAQSHAQRRRPFHLLIDTRGKGEFEEPEVFNLDVRGNVLRDIRVITPSFTSRNKRFDVMVRFEDSYGNLTSNAPDDTLIELTYENIRENLNWKLFVPETGFLNLPNLYFNEPGIYTIQLINTKTKESFRSSPIKCFADNHNGLYWGQLHGESEKFDSTENIENCLCHIRDEKALNFTAASPFDNNEETPNEVWKMVSQNIDEYNETDRFVTFLGFQWEGPSPKEGIRHMIYAKDNKPILRSKDSKYNTLKKIYKSQNPKELISIPTFTMGKGYDFDFNDFDPEFERVVEIYNAWGSSECLQKEGNSWPVNGTGKYCAKESAEGSIQKALQNNCRFGFVAGGLDDRGIYAGFFEGDQEQYCPGFTGIIAKDHSRASLFEALYKRSCYATTGKRIILDLNIAGLPIGSISDTEEKHGFIYNRHLSGFAAGTEDLDAIEIVRNGEVIHTIKPKEGYHTDFTYDDMVPLGEVTLDAKDKKPPFVYYYMRVTQKDGHMAWSSPIWIDNLH